MSFGFHTDEGLFYAARPSFGSSVPFVFEYVDGSAQYLDYVYYFGTQDDSIRLVTRNNPESDNVIISVVDATPKRAASTTYNVGDVIGYDGHLFTCSSTGSTSPETDFAPVSGSPNLDGTVQWKHLGAAYRPEIVKMALSASALEQAQWGAPLVLGKSVRGGMYSGIAIHIRMNNRLATGVYDLTTVPQIEFRLNDCVIVSS